ncbi:hypothetical protein DFQ28_010908 [Apophysomyces sp. BC1034]|nr:hypothetical protein DFQ30_010638 [Apophysomyces sp. BC1015]KAG0169590.1 hypothetical protein DFQ29_009631 [Apophysomyces sp. BC1021]KAG0184564.1 hypothetical protein DFQ28_010908 [Apophysomyces sp. BC1034]
MAASRLPNEILEVISTSMVMADLRICSGVCRSWQTFFKFVLQRATVHLKFEVQLRMFFRRRSLHQVRQLRCKFPVAFEAGELSQLRRHCPLLEWIDFVPWGQPYDFSGWPQLQQIPPIRTRVELDCLLTSRHCRALHHLVLKDEPLLSLHARPSSLRSFGSLQHLELHGMMEALCDTMLRTMHASLPHLLHLVLSNLWLKSAEEDEEQQHSAEQGADALVLAPDLRSLKLNGSRVSSCWIAQLAHKYPGLDTLEFSSIEPLHSGSFGPALVKTIGQLPRLTSLKTNFFDWFHEPHAKMALDRMVGRLTQLELINVSVTPSFSSLIGIVQSHLTAATLKINHAPPSPPSPSFLSSLQYCARLTSLVIHATKDRYFFDSLLDQLTMLETLRLDNAELCLSGEAHAIPTRPHPLRSLTLEDVSFWPGILDGYVGHHCPGLIDLRLQSCAQVFLPTDTRAEIRIDLSRHSLRSVEINRLRPIVLTKANYHWRRYSSACSFSTAIFSLAQLETADETWWHIPTPGEQSHAVWTLSAKDIARVTSYRMTTHDWTQTTAMTREDWTSKENWEKDIPYGCVTLCCQSVAEFTYCDIEWA